jgi:hypothetical protein
MPRKSRRAKAEPHLAKDELPSGWALSTVAMVGSVRVGRQRSPDRQSGRSSTKYLRAANITTSGLDLANVFEMDFTPSERKVFSLNPGDIVLAEASGSPRHVGRSAIWRNEIPGCCFQNTVIRFRPHAAVSGYAVTVFRHYAASGLFARAARGVGIQHLGGSRFAQMSFPLPPIPEQHRIAIEAERRLGELKEASISLRSALQRIEQQKREILATAVAGKLVDQEATLAEREGRPFEDSASLLNEIPTLNRGQRQLFEDESQLATAADDLMQRRLPPGWTWIRIFQAGEPRLGKALSPRERGPRLRKYLRVANVLEDFIDATDIKQMHFSDEEYKVYRLEPGDVLLNEGQSLELAGRAAMFRGEVPGACYQNRLIRFRAYRAVDPEYALIVFLHYLHAGEFRKIARRSTNIANLGVRRFAAMPFPLPPLAEQHRIATEARRRLDSCKAQATSVYASLERLPLMEAELLSAAVSGVLVPQNKGDEPATALLQRLGPPPSNGSVAEVAQLAPNGGVAESMERSSDHRTRASRTLVETLRQSRRPLRLPELFSMAGYDRDSTEEVERFYLALRTALGVSIRVAGKAIENALVEATRDAP